MTHLDDETLSAAALVVVRGEEAVPGHQTELPELVSAHLGLCQRCTQRFAAVTKMAAAVRDVDAETIGMVVAPSFDTALGARLASWGSGELSESLVIQPAARSAHHRGGVVVPAVVPAAGLASSWRLAVAVLARQRRLLPGAALGVVTAVGLVVAVVLALSVPTPTLSGRVFSAAASLVVLVGAAAVCSPRWDPRRELLAVMPVPPVAVFGCRLVLVLGSQILASLAASVVAVGLGLSIGAGRLILEWLGPALMAAATLVVVSVWRSATVGAIAGALVWFLGVAAGLAQAQNSTVGLGAVLAPLSTTTPWVLALVALLFGVAMMTVNATVPGRRTA